MLAAVSHRSTGQHLRLVNGFSSRTMCKAGKDAFSVGGRWVRLSAAVRIECLEGVVCHERAVCVQRCGTVREMKEGPSRSAVRCRSQATASCCRQERWWGALRKRRDMIPAGKVERGERK